MLLLLLILTLFLLWELYYESKRKQKAKRAKIISNTVDVMFLNKLNKKIIPMNSSTNNFSSSSQ